MIRSQDPTQIPFEEEMDEEQLQQMEVETEGKTMDLEKDKRDKIVSSVLHCFGWVRFGWVGLLRSYLCIFFVL